MVDTSAHRPLRLMDQLRQKIRFKHYSLSTERVYCQWVRQYILFHGKQHPKDLAEPEVVRFLNYLANDRNVAASTQNQALSALVFLYKEVIENELGDLSGLSYAKKPKRLPVVLTQAEAFSVLACLSEPYKTAVSLLYGSGLRLNECLSLRVLDVDIARRELVVRRGKGSKDRRTMLPEKVIPSLEKVMANTERLFEEAMAAGVDYVFMPDGLGRKYPNAGKEFKWQYVFASGNISADPRSG